MALGGAQAGGAGEVRGVRAGLDALGREPAALAGPLAEQVTLGAFPTATWSLIPWP
ncbi:hypothetical protein [Nonomuraea sp. NPDC049309]|uniref:hypothetical protein n=1 Tax=Nonomuraea sp. NPDC049309 TaxID=3364350 RepID=UPI00370F9BFE